jgi:tRNA(His) guanylyltransferase
MAGTKFAYVRNFELPDPLLPDTFIVLRIDGHSFHRQFKTFASRLTHTLTLRSYRFSEDHEFAKPNDVRALQLMDEAAVSVVKTFTDITLAFGESDEFRRVDFNPTNKPSVAEERLRGISFLFKKSTSVYNRRHAKLLTTVVSQFTSSYVFNWAKHFPGVSLKYPPSFDGRIVLYPTERAVRDYFSWRQADSEYRSLELMPRGLESTSDSPHKQPVQYRVLGVGARRESNDNTSSRSPSCRCRPVNRRWLSC